MQERAIDRTLLPRGAQQEPGYLLEGAAGHQARRVSAGGDRVDQRPTVFVRGLEGGAEGRTGVAESRGDLVLQMKIAAPERRRIRQDTAESVGLVHEAGGEHTL